MVRDTLTKTATRYTEAMRILHLLSNYIYTGPAELLLSLIKAQVNAGHHVSLAVDSLRHGDLVSVASRQGIALEKSLVLSVKAGPILQVRDFLHLRKIWREGLFDIVHCHKSHEHSLAALSRSYHSRTRLVRTLNKGVRSGAIRAHLLRKTDGLIAVSRRDAEKLVSSGITSPDSVVTIRTVVDTEQYTPGDSGAILRQSLGIEKQAPVAGLVSRIKKGRGHLLLLESWRSVHKVLPAARLIISGRGEWADKIAEKARDTSFDGTVHVIGYQDDLPRLYRSLDVMVMLAPGNDGTCRAALQAMACAKPLVAMDTGALSDIVIPEKTGLLCRQGSRDELAKSLIRLLSNRKLMNDWGVEARKRAEKDYTLENNFKQVQALYEGILSSMPGVR